MTGKHIQVLRERKCELKEVQEWIQKELDELRRPSTCGVHSNISVSSDKEEESEGTKGK